MSQDIYTHRRSDLLQHLAELGIDMAMIRRPIHIYYLTGILFNPYDRFAALLLDSRDLSCSIIWSSLEQGNAAEQGIPEIIYGDDEDPLGKLPQILAGCRILGAELDDLSLKLAERIKSFLPQVQFSEVNTIITGMRAVKSAAEIASIRQAACLGDQALREVLAGIRPGRHEKEILLDLFTAMSVKPGVSTDTLIIQVLSGERSALPNGESNERRLQVGDSVTVDFGVHHHHYWSDMTRNFFIGQPSRDLEKIYGVVLAAQAAAIEKIRPGLPVREIDQAARAVIEKAGYGQYFIHKTGHGLGLEIHEDPPLNGVNPELLRENMVIAVEPGIYLPGLGGVRIEDDILVTRTGFEVLNGYPKGLAEMILK